MAKVSSDEKVLYQFPANLRVLAVDNDPSTLEFIKNTCSQCKYEVTIHTESPLALNLVREKKDRIDVILIEVHMPTMNGYEFLQHVSKEIDVPVIVMSLDYSKDTVMKAVQLGACDFWIKPLHEHQFKNMWTHVSRKALNENKIQKGFGSLEDDGRGRKLGNDNSEFASFDVVRHQSNGNSSSREAAADVDESEHEHCGPSTKKPRVIWLPELHRKFVKAVNKLALDQAVPKRILQEMNVPGLTRQNVASHLQKYRNFLKEKSRVTQTQEHTEMPLPNMVPGTIKNRVGACERHAEQALAECLSNITNNFPHPQPIRTQADPSIYGARPPSNALAIQRSNALVGSLQQQQQQLSLINQQISPIISRQSSMMISGNPASVFRNNDFGLLSPQTSNPLSVAQIHGGNTTGGSRLNRYTATTTSITQQLQNSSLTSGAVRSFPASVPPDGSLYQESPNISASGFNNQFFSTDIDDNTTNEELNSRNNPEKDHTLSK